MDVEYLGPTGLRVSELWLGTWTFGRETAEPLAHGMLDHFVSEGGMSIDTANAYHDGLSEEIVGRWLCQRKSRDDLVLATKVYFRMGPGPNDVGLSRKHILTEIDASLRRLQTDYIDLYQVHAWDPATPLEETLATLDSLVGAGKVRYIGASNYAGWQLMKSLMISRANKWQPFVALQPEYNLLSREIEREVLPVCRDSGLGVLAWSPLGGGWLAGKQRRGAAEAAPGTRTAETSEWWQPDAWERRNVDHTWHVVDCVNRLAAARGVPAAQVSLNWLRAQEVVTAPILGARSLDQLRTNLGCLQWRLDAGELRELDAVSEGPAPYPYYLLDYLADTDERYPFEQHRACSTHYKGRSPRYETGMKGEMKT